MDCAKRVETARSKLVYNYPFFGALSLYLLPKETKDIPTAGVDGRHLFYNPDFFDELKDNELEFVMAHEVLHCALGHVFAWRRGHRDPNLFNVAADYVINDMLKAEGLTAPKECLYDKKYHGMSTEEVYALLPKPDPNCPQCGGTGSCSEEEDDQEGEEGGQPCPKCGAKSGGIGFDIMPADTETTDEEQKLSRQWDERLVNSARIAKQRGYLPAGIERILDHILNPKLPWHILLSNMISEVARDDYDTMRYDRRLIDLGIYFPDLYRETIYAIIAIDTSGSISSEELQDFLSETWGILRSRNVGRIRLMSCDAAVHYDEEFNPQDAPPDSIPGGGGTDFKPVFDKVNAENQRPACLIYFTDTFGDFPDEKPPYQVFWVTKTSEENISKPPFGKVLYF